MSCSFWELSLAYNGGHLAGLQGYVPHPGEGEEGGGLGETPILDGEGRTVVEGGEAKVRAEGNISVAGGG